MTNNKNELKQNDHRTWLDKNGATIYGIAVFAGLIAVSIVHMVLST